MNKKMTPSDNDGRNKTNIDVFYEAQTHLNYKLDERVLKEIVQRNTRAIDSNKKLNLIIFYRNTKTHNLVMKNNLLPPPKPLQKTNVIYEFQCPISHGYVTDRYVGMTQNTLSKRLTFHLQKGSYAIIS